MNTAIGGYFALELPLNSGEYHRTALRFQSARAAFLALLREGRPSTVWMPWYICECTTEPLAMCGIPVRRYALDKDLRILSAEPEPNDWLLYVNYFGLCGRHAAETLERFDRNRVIIDSTQAFFAEPADCLATIYSPRKFFGVPDGGYLVTNLNVREPDEIDNGSIGRSQHLFQRLGDAPEPGYADFVTAEASLSKQEPKRMSLFTQTLLSRIQYAEIRAQRVANFTYLHERLVEKNSFPIFLSNNDVPLCYPYFGDNSFLRYELRSHRIYTPVYWPELAQSTVVPDFEAKLAQQTVFLPCDQRMKIQQLETMLSFIQSDTEVEI
jgi:hypothetical protein